MPREKNSLKKAIIIYNNGSDKGAFWNWETVKTIKFIFQILGKIHIFTSLNTEAYLRLCPTYMKELFCENSLLLKVHNKKIFVRALNASLKFDEHHPSVVLIKHTIIHLRLTLVFM